jgi:hypothetical protein
MRTQRKAARFAALAVGSLLGGLVAGSLARGWELVLTIAGFLGYLHFGGRAMSHWKVRVAETLSPGPSPWTRRRIPLGRLAAGLALALLAAPALGQQTIFNVPSADVLDRGKTYLELDALWRPWDPDFAVFSARGVYGFGSNIEAGVNFTGFVTPGRSVPIATPNIKWQPWHNDKLAFTTGVFGLFYLRGSEDGNPAVLWYGEASYKLPTNTRLTAGGYWASSGYAASDPQAGALLAFEQKVNDHLNIIADWISGENGLGYFTPGVSVPLGAWTIYAGYSIKNGDSRGNAMLLEFGFTF